LWKYNFTEVHYSIFTGRGSLKESPGAAFAASAAPVRTPIDTVDTIGIQSGNMG